MNKSILVKARFTGNWCISIAMHFDYDMQQSSLIRAMQICMGNGSGEVRIKHVHSTVQIVRNTIFPCSKMPSLPLHHLAASIRVQLRMRTVSIEHFHLLFRSGVKRKIGLQLGKTRDAFQWWGSLNISVVHILRTVHIANIAHKAPLAPSDLFGWECNWMLCAKCKNQTWNFINELLYVRCSIMSSHFRSVGPGRDYFEWYSIWSDADEWWWVG